MTRRWHPRSANLDVLEATGRLGRRHVLEHPAERQPAGVLDEEHAAEREKQEQGATEVASRDKLPVATFPRRARQIWQLWIETTGRHGCADPNRRSAAGRVWTL